MPRYIDVDKFKEHIASFTGLFTEEGFMIDYQAVLTAIDNASAAEVVPKSEVERLQIELDSLRGAANSYKMHYENLAREIFAEIEKTVNACVVDESLFKPAYFEFRKFNEQLAELKKKYTEGEE